MIVMNLWKDHEFVMGGMFSTVQALYEAIEQRLQKSPFELEKLERAVRSHKEYDLGISSYWDKDFDYVISISINKSY